MEQEISNYTTKAEPKAWADSVPVFCAHDSIINTAELVPNPKNPNKHPDTQIQMLGRIIRATGWRQPITVSKRSGFIVKGHGRLAAALLEELAEVPVDYQNYTNEAEEYADLVADNRLAELAELDNKMLADIFADIDTGEIPLALTGYTEEEYGKLVTALSEAVHDDQEEPSETPEPAEQVTQKGDLWILRLHRVVCGDCTEEETIQLLFNTKSCSEDPVISLQRVNLKQAEQNKEIYKQIGAALIAAEAMGQKSYTMELEPGFVDIIVRRYIQITGKTTGIQCIRNGRSLTPEEMAPIFDD